MGRSGGGGGRSSGGGGSRSSGGFGGSRSSGGFSGGGRSSGSSSASRPSRPSGNSSASRPSGGSGNRSTSHTSSSRSGGGFFGSSNDRRHNERHYHESTRTVFVPVPTQPRPQNVQGSSSNTGGRAGGSKVGCLVFLIIFLLFVLIANSAVNGDLKNTTERTPLSGQVSKTEWYQDDLNWISNKQVLIDGLEDFYKETGIQPYVLLLPYDASFWNADGSCNANAMDDYLGKVYEETFTDEAHFIFAYFSGQYDSKGEMEGEFRYMCGYSADTIMDSEAIKILWGYFEENYYDTSLSLEAMIADTFTATGSRIMSRPTNVYDVVSVVATGVIVALVIVCIVRICRIIASRRREKEEYNRRILETPLETFDTGIDTSDLEKKYEEEKS